jgi:hypothetical protein
VTARDSLDEVEAIHCPDITNVTNAAINISGASGHN